MDLEPEGKVFVVITLTGSFTEGKDEFWVVYGAHVILIHVQWVSVMEIIKRVFCKRCFKKIQWVKLDWLISYCLMVYWFGLPDYIYIFSKSGNLVFCLTCWVLFLFIIILAELVLASFDSCLLNYTLDSCFGANYFVCLWIC